MKKTKDPRVLRVIVSTERREEQSIGCIHIHPFYSISIDFEQVAAGEICRTLTYVMSCRPDWKNEERAREEFLQSGMAASIGWGWNDHIWDHSEAPVEVQISDPGNILKWLFPDVDFNDFFKNQTFINDQPLRLPASDTGAV